MPFPLATGPEPLHPKRLTPRWMLRQKLQENAEFLLSLPIGPLVQLQYAMALSGNRHIWNPHTQTVEEVLVPGENGPRPVPLDEHAHMKLLSDLTDRLLPKLKNIDHTQLTKQEAAIESDMKNLTMDQLKQALDAIKSTPTPEPQPQPPCP